MLNNNDLKEYNIKDVWKLKRKSLLISPTGKIYIFNKEHFDEQILMLLNKKHVNLEIVIDKIREELYQRDFEILEEELNDMRYIIVNLFGFIIYEDKSLIINYPNRYYTYNNITNIQLQILYKLCKKKIEGGKIYAAKKSTFKNLCYYKGEITKKRIN